MRNYDMMLSGLNDLVENPTPRVPVALCLDVSGSMIGDPIAELNAGVGQYLTEMQEDELTRYSVETALVTFASEVECVADFGVAEKLGMPQLTAGGITRMGEGMEMALDLLEQRKAAYKATGVDYYQPILVLMSDGAPNGDPKVLKKAAQRTQELCEQRRLTVVTVGIGPDADLDMLAMFTPKRRPVRLNGLQFREFFSWLSQSVANMSASLPGDEDELDMDALNALEAEPWPEGTL
ncbi:vWA domain-containing protein [Dysosmobacter sp.]|jgi:uncharacterized protein YegL|uniref:vWA domain-containing protein n=1 Tax=Dysosmobacter sp. TaxID=2591382 RepID=UPI003D8C9BED